MNTLKFSLAMIFNPLSTIKAVKQNRGKLKAYPAILLIALVPLMRIIYLLTVHYPLSSINRLDINYGVEITVSVVPILSFIVASFLITAINDGETLFKESVILGAYCLMPYLIFTIPVILLSWLWTATMLSVFNSINMLIIAWCVFLTFLTLKETNDYSLIKTIGIYLVIIFTIILLLATVLLVYALISQIISFVLGLFAEIGYIMGR